MFAVKNPITPVDSFCSPNRPISIKGVAAVRGSLTTLLKLPLFFSITNSGSLW